MAFREHKYRLERPWNSHQSPTSEFATSVRHGFIWRKPGMSKTPRDKGPADQKTDTTRLAGPFGNADGGATVARTNADKGRGDGALVRIALRFTAWAERWFPDAFIFVAIAVVVVAAGALVNGAPV